MSVVENENIRMHLTDDDIHTVFLAPVVGGAELGDDVSREPGMTR